MLWAGWMIQEAPDWALQNVALLTQTAVVGSVATVGFQASASARTRSTKPDLRLEHSGPLKVLEGEPVKFSIELSNPGSGAATHVVLEEVIPTGLSHSSGGKLEYEVGMIEPGQTRHLELTLKAAQAGHVVNTLVARADGNLLVEDVVEMDVVAPKLQVAVQGPKTRYLERQAEFTVSVANPGTASAKNVELVANLPRGLKFVSTNNSGYFDQTRNAVIWSLEQLPAGEMGRAQFTAMPVEMGSFQVRAEGKADRDLTARQEHTIAVEGIAALFFGLADKTDPIEAGDFYVEAGSPGHAVIVLDVIQGPDGERLGLLGQGFMPAEDIHVLRSPVARDGVWFPLPSDTVAVLDTPSWRPFSADARRRLH